MRKLLTGLCALLITGLVQAQNGTISGKITDSSGKKPLPLTTITIFKAKDTVIVTYRLTTEAGEFKIPSLPFDVPLRLLATYSGYEGFRQDFTLTADKPSFNFGILKMVNTSKQLDEVIVIAERPPVIIRQDTIEFNATAFKTLPTALLEDLLKKLPGMQVDENGDLTYNGRKTNRILVDGKRFFGDDPKMATRNLPSNLVDKVQVLDDKEQIALNNDGDMSNIGVVINLTLKKNIKKALFGKVYGGGGSDGHYETGGIINTFRDTLQMSMLAYSNNINRSGFSIQDVNSLGGFNRSGFNSMSMWTGGGREGFAINGISFGGLGSGITTSTGAGFNLNHSPSKKFSLFAQYFYGGSHNDIISEGNTQRFFGDTILLSKGSGTSVTTTNAHSISAGGNWNKDSLTYMSFNGSMVFNTNHANSNSAANNDNNKLGAVSNALGTNLTNGSSDAYNYSINISHRFAGKKGRSISLYHYLNYTKNPVDYINESVNNYTYPFASSLVLQQLRSTNSPNTNANLNINYSDLVSPKLTLRLNQRFDYTNQAQLIGVYSKHAATGFYDSLNTLLSNDLRREQTRWASVASMSYRINKVSINLGTTLLEQWINNNFAKGAINSKLHYSDLLFSTGFNWKRVNFNISQDVSAPSISYLNPVTDNSNPFYIVNGNPGLLPSRQISFNFNGNFVNVKTNTTYNVNASAGNVDDAVIQSLVVNSTGVQVSTPVNVNGVKRLNISVNMNKQYKKNPKFIFAINMGVYGNINKTPMLFNNIMSETSLFSITPTVRFNMNWHDVVEFNPNMNMNFRKNTYTNPSFATTDYTGQNIGSEFIVRLPKKFVWETNVAYSYISNLAPGLPKSNVYWNAALTFLMFKEDKGQIKLAVYDILNRNNNVNRWINGNVITDSRTNVLQRYFMLTYTYNIRALAGQKTKVGGRQTGGMFFF